MTSRLSAGLALRSGQHAELAPDRVAERPRVLYNRASRTFVMWCHVDEADYELARVGIAVSSSPQVIAAADAAWWRCRHCSLIYTAGDSSICCSVVMI